MLNKPGFWRGFGQVFKGIAKSFGQILLLAVAKVIDEFAKIPTLGKLGGVADSARGKAADLGSGGQDVKSGLSVLEPILKESFKKMGKNYIEVGKAAIDSFKSAGNIVDVSESKAKLKAEIVDPIKALAEENRKANAAKKAARQAAQPAQTSLGISSGGVAAIPNSFGGFGKEIAALTGRNPFELLQTEAKTQTKLQQKMTDSLAKLASREPQRPMLTAGAEVFS